MLIFHGIPLKITQIKQITEEGKGSEHIGPDWNHWMCRRGGGSGGGGGDDDDDDGGGGGGGDGGGGGGGLLAASPMVAAGWACSPLLFPTRFRYDSM